MTAALKPPAVYAEWVPLLDRFAAGEDDVLSLMQGGSIQWSNVVADRWIRTASAALSLRLDRLSQETQRRLARSRGEFDVLGVLRWVTSQLVPLAAFATLAPLRPDVRDHFDETCRRWVESTQASLIASSSRAADQGQLARSLRAAALRWPPVAGAVGEAAAPPAAGGSHPRQVLG
jgi:hypothetical protein